MIVIILLFVSFIEVKGTTDWENKSDVMWKTQQWCTLDNNNNNFIYSAVPIYELMALYIINIKIHLTVKKAQVL